MILKGGETGEVFFGAAAGPPLATTAACCANLGLQDGEDCFIAHHPLGFAEKGL